MHLDTRILKDWFQESKRDLPWRTDLTPYKVWISEVMLQQTQAVVVIPYFLRWMHQFPTVKHLAEASLDEVIKAWEGLGYYSRARYLHQGAKYIVEHYNGELPSTEEELKKIKGLGPYTIGAILSFAFHQKKSAVDGNVLRVLSRYFNVQEDIKKQKTVNYIRDLAEQILPEEEPWLVNEGLIELGATICQKKANCTACPIKHHCEAHRLGITDQLPIKSRGVKTTYLYRSVLVLIHEGHYLLKKGEKGNIMQDLHEFPFIETDQAGLTHLELEQQLQQIYGITASATQNLQEIVQTFTRYQAYLRPVIFTCISSRPVISDCRWIPIADCQQLAFSSGHRRILFQLTQ